MRFLMRPAPQKGSTLSSSTGQAIPSLQRRQTCTPSQQQRNINRQHVCTAYDKLCHMFCHCNAAACNEVIWSRSPLSTKVKVYLPHPFFYKERFYQPFHCRIPGRTLSNKMQHLSALCNELNNFSDESGLISILIMVTRSGCFSFRAFWSAMTSCLNGSSINLNCREPVDQCLRSCH